MHVPLKLNAIDQEHLQELYDAAGVARDELPYTDAFDKLCEGFQDRTFKNASREQVFAAIVKYVRSSGNVAGELTPPQISDEQAKQLKMVLSKHVVGGKILPYSDAFDAARAEFNKVAASALDEQAFWHAILRSHGPKRMPPRRKKVAVAKQDEDEEE